MNMAYYALGICLWVATGQVFWFIWGISLAIALDEDDEY